MPQASVIDFFVHDNFTVVEYANYSVQALIRPAAATGNTTVPKSVALI
jgi:hypothetical protein